MKKLILTFSLSLLGFTAFAQNAYEKAMTEKISKIETAKTADELTALTNDFERIGAKENSQWLPYYYAAYSTIQKGRVLVRSGKTAELDPVAEQAEKYISKAEALSANNAEIYILKKITSRFRMMVDPMSRYMQEAPIAQNALSKAKELDPENPRITVLLAEDAYFTPEQYGGSKPKGVELFKKSLEQFAAYKPKTALDPNWGKAEAEFFLSQK
ncbi:MAG: hypothetical protein J6N74_01075 [Chryseobacterium sp.]|nr:hypothetical protein [Chryseobacterium sp.]